MLAALTALLVGLGYLLGGRGGTAIAFLVAAVAADTWRRTATDNALIEYLNVVMMQDALAVRANVAAGDAFLALVAHLVEKQIPAALALQKRARRSFLENR